MPLPRPPANKQVLAVFPDNGGGNINHRIPPIGRPTDTNSPPESTSGDPNARILGIPDRWFWAIGYAAFCVFVEVLLNMGGLLVWEYEWWHRSFIGVWLIFFFGYFHFYVAVIIVLGMKRMRTKLITVGSLYAIVIAANILGLGIFGWVY
jgi:hypothetical protein